MSATPTTPTEDAQPLVRLPQRCIYCKSTDERLTGDGLRKHCIDELGCSRRVRQQHAPTTSGELLDVAFPKKAPQTRPETASKDQSTAHALIEMLQERAHIPALSGPVTYGDTLTLPLPALQSRQVILGKPGCGKTHATAIITENCYLNNIPVCVIDTLGNLWGLRAAGVRPGFRLPIIGGVHGDRDLHNHDAVELAQVFARGHSLLIDCSLLPLDDQQYFAAAFFAELLRILRRPAHVIVEEAETFAPAFTRTKSHFASQGAITLFARQIRNFGVGWTFSTQRPQLLHPDIIDASSVFLAMQTTGDAAQRAIGMEAKSRLGKMIATAILNELGQLKRGEAWLMPDPSWLGDDQQSAPIKFRFRERFTYNSSFVPTFGQELPPTPALVDINLRQMTGLTNGEKK